MLVAMGAGRGEDGDGERKDEKTGQMMSLLTSLMEYFLILSI